MLIASNPVAMSDQHFDVIGLTDGREPFFPPEVMHVIASGKVFSGGTRHHQIVSHLLPQDAEWIDITVPLDDVFARYEGIPHVVVFASGDPLFFGFGNTIRRRLPQASLRVFPAENSLQMLAHRLLLDYHDMKCVSLTGRPWDALDEALILGLPLIGALTDNVHTPAAAAGRMLEYGYDNYRMNVGVRLGNDALETLWSGTLKEAAEKQFDTPNCFIIEQTQPRPRPFGIPEGDFALLDGRVNMITKMPVRLLTLQMLDLRGRRCLWDVGFCTGSVSIEARLQFPHLKVCAFEIREAGRELIEENSRRHGAPGIEVSIGDFLKTDISTFPRPDAVFIGGHGGRLEEMLRRIDSVLLPGGVIVFNSVSAESLEMFIHAAEAVGRRISGRTHIALDGHNPITILRAE